MVLVFFVSVASVVSTTIIIIPQPELDFNCLFEMRKPTRSLSYFRRIESKLRKISETNYNMDKYQMTPLQILFCYAHSELFTFVN